MKQPLFKAFRFVGYHQRQTLFVGFDYQAANDFVSAYRAENPDTNGCYIAAIYPKRKAA